MNIYKSEDLSLPGPITIALPRTEIGLLRLTIRNMPCQQTELKLV